MGHPSFNPPGKPPKLTGRRSTITGLFTTTLTPYIEPTEAEVDEALSILGMSRESCSCAYCGDTKTEWDHFRAVVEGRQPTGYITELHNLVPSCGKCNQSRGNTPWREWMVGNAKLSPTTRGKPDVRDRMAKLDAYEKWTRPICLDYAAIAGPMRWQQHREFLEEVLRLLERAEALAVELRAEARTKAMSQRNDA
jgi:hypothetical protein